MSRLAWLPQLLGETTRVLWKVLPTRPSLSEISTDFNSSTHQIICQPSAAKLLLCSKFLSCCQTPLTWCLVHCVLHPMTTGQPTNSRVKFQQSSPTTTTTSPSHKSQTWLQTPSPGHRLHLPEGSLWTRQSERQTKRVEREYNLKSVSCWRVAQNIESKDQKCNDQL